MQFSREFGQTREDQIQVSSEMQITLGGGNRVSRVEIRGIALDIPTQAETPIVLETERGKVTVEDLAFHPMNLATRWHAREKLPDLQLSDHQDRIIVTIENNDVTESYVLPKFFNAGEPLAKIVLDRKKSPRPFTVEMAEVQAGKIKGVRPKKPSKGSKILHGTQILGHVQNAADMQRWAHGNNTLQSKWKFALPPTERTEKTLAGVKAEGIPLNGVVVDWSYAGGKDFRTGKDFVVDFTDPRSFTSAVGFIAANASLCLAIARGEYAVVSTNFRMEPQVLREINPHILTAGITYTFLTGKPGERAAKHADLPRFVRMLQRVQESLDAAPDRVASFGLEPDEVDDWWEISRQKVQDLDLLLYRTFDLDPNLPSQLNKKTHVLEVPHLAPEIRVSREQARAHIGEIIGRQLAPHERVIILAGESDDGSFRKRAEEVFRYAQQHDEVQVIMPLKASDQRIAGLELPVNAHPIGFRGDWLDIVPGGDVAFLRGSWGEMADLIAAGIVPLITSPGTVPMDADLDTTQFLTEVSGERACNLSLLIQTLQKRGVSADVINGLVVDLDEPNDPHTLQEAIAFALQPEVASQMRAALSSIQRNGTEWSARIHEQLLDNGRMFSPQEINRLQRAIWSPIRSGRRWPWFQN